MSNYDVFSILLLHKGVNSYILNKYL